MINFTKKQWYNEGEVGVPLVPLSKDELNRIEKGIKDSVDSINNSLYSYWWKKLEVKTMHSATIKNGIYIYPWTSSTKNNKIKIYYSNNILVSYDVLTQKFTVDLENQKSSAGFKYGDAFPVTSEPFIYFKIDGSDIVYEKESSSNTLSLSKTYSGDKYGFKIQNIGEVEPLMYYELSSYISSTNPNEYKEGWNEADGVYYQYIGGINNNTCEQVAMRTGVYLGDGKSDRFVGIGVIPRCVYIYDLSYTGKEDIISVTTSDFSYSVNGTNISIDRDRNGVVLKGSYANEKNKMYGYIVFY